MLTTLLSVLAGAAIGTGIGAVGFGAGWAGTKIYDKLTGNNTFPDDRIINGVPVPTLHTWADYRNEAKHDLENIINNNEILSKLDLDDLINQAANIGYITKADKTKYLNLLKELGKDSDYGFWESITDWSGKNTEEIARLYGVLTKVAPEIEQVLDNYAGLDVKQTLAANIPAIQSAPSPGYFDIDFENKWANTDANVHNLKWWTGKELAEHHDLPYDVDTMYNAIKQGTEAAVARDQYTSRTLREEGIKDRPWEQASYLNTLRNTKSDAVASGATAGAQAANELLGMLNANQTSAQNQIEVANNRWGAVQESLLADAQAAITANQRYQSLGTNIANNIEGLYANDVIHRQAELEAQAELNAANELLRNTYIENNANMFRAYTEANANINSARQSMTATTNRYAWMWDRFFGRAKEDGYDDRTARAIANNDFFNWVGTEATNTQNYRSLRNQQEQSY